MAKIIELKDKDNTFIYPITHADAVYMPNGVDTVGRFIADSEDVATHIEFASNEITKTLKSGTTVVISFGDSMITETTKTSEGKVVSTKTTRFGKGSIDIEVK